MCSWRGQPTPFFPIVERNEDLDGEYVLFTNAEADKQLAVASEREHLRRVISTQLRHIADANKQIEELDAAIATPEIHAGIVTRVVERRYDD